MYIMWWGGAVLCMNTAYELTQNFLQNCDQDTFFLNVLTVLCIYQFPEIFPENISKIFVSASCCFIVYEKSNSRLTLNTVLKTGMAVVILIRIQTQKCWLTSVPAQSWVNNSASASSIPELPETMSSQDMVGSQHPAPHAHICLVWFL